MRRDLSGEGGPTETDDAPAGTVVTTGVVPGPVEGGGVGGVGWGVGVGGGGGGALGELQAEANESFVDLDKGKTMP